MKANTDQMIDKISVATIKRRFHSRALIDLNNKDNLHLERRNCSFHAPIFNAEDVKTKLLA